MARLVRKNINIRPQQDEWLKRMVEESDLTESFFIRAALDMLKRQYQMKGYVPVGRKGKDV